MLTRLPLVLSSKGPLIARNRNCLTTICGIIGSSSLPLNVALSNHSKKPAKDRATSQCNNNHHRVLSSYSNNSTRSYPNYTIYNDECLLSFAPIQPTFQRTGKDGKSVSLGAPGKMLVQFTPKIGSNNRYERERISVALTVEEMGLVISHLAKHEIEISRRTSNSENGGAAVVYDSVDKVLTMIPTGEDESVHFIVDFYMDGIGGQPVPGRDDGLAGPFQVTVQAGEVEVIKSIFKDSITHLLGWNKMMDIASTNSLRQSLSSPGGSGGKYEFVGGESGGNDGKKKFFSGGGPRGSINF